MKNKVVGDIIIVLLVLGLVQVTLTFVPIGLSEPGEVRKEVWKLVWVNNTLPYNTIVDLNVTVNSRKGVNIACSSNVTAYSDNVTQWQGLGYANYTEWLNGTSSNTYHWGEMDWSVTNGSLTPISYSDIQFWGDMYLDSGGGVNYTTFMGNTYMADWNLSDSRNNPDIVYQAYWQGNQVKVIDDLFVPANANMTVVFKIVMTEPGSYTFNLTATPGVTISPSSWTVGGVSTLLVPDDYLTIQGAVNAASPGINIYVAAGTYSESQILVDKPLKIFGAGPTVTIIDGGNTALSTVGMIRITANADNVTFSGFTVRNAGPAGGVRVGIYASSNASGVSYTVSNNIILGTNNPDDDQDYGFYTYGGKENLMFINNSVTQTGANPVLLERHTGSTDISYNVLDVGVWGSDAIFCMTYGGDNITTLQRVSNNTFDLGTGGPFNYDHRAAAITFASAYNSATLGNGTFTNLQITTNTMKNLTSYRRGIAFWNGATGDGTGGNIIAPVINGNVINASVGAAESFGMRFLGLVTNATITNNNVTNCAYGAYMNNSTGVKLSSNNIFNSTNYGLSNNGTMPVLASYNWWGNESGPTHTTNPSGTGDSVSDNVLFEPWLIKPYPPLVPITVVYVNPQIVTLETPALGTQFALNVTIANVTSMYGFQFTISWNSTLLYLTNPTTAARIPAVWGNNYISQFNYSLAGGNYSLFEAARSPAPSFNGTTTVAYLVFRSVFDPVYPVNVTCSLSLSNVIVSDTASNAIKRLVYSGNYTCKSARPKIVFTSKEYTAKQVPTEFDAYVNVTNVVNLTGFKFEFKFNDTLLRVLSVSVPSFSGTPVVIIGWLNDTVFVNTTGIAIPINGTTLLAKVRFKVERGFVWNVETRGVNSTLNFTIHELNDGAIDDEPINGTYRYTPVPGDLDMDGEVTIIDLSGAAHVFGLNQGESGWLDIADLNRDGTINVLDIVLIARNFGRKDPEQ